MESSQVRIFSYISKSLVAQAVVGHFEKEKKVKGKNPKNLKLIDYGFDKKLAADVRFSACGGTPSLVGFLAGLEFWFWFQLLSQSGGGV